MLTPTVNYLGPAHPHPEATLSVVSGSRHARPRPEMGAAHAPRQRSRRTVLHPKLIALLTTIAMFTPPAADALARNWGHF